MLRTISLAALVAMSFGALAGAGPTCLLDPPCTGQAEGEPCDEGVPDTTNGGCNSTPETFSPISIDGPPVCGTNWATDGFRDTDWYGFSIETADTHLDVVLRAETNSTALLAELSAGGICPVIGLPTGGPAFSGACASEQVVASYFFLDPGDYVLFVGAGTEIGEAVFDGFPCPVGAPTNNAYEVTLRTSTVEPPPLCPGDLNGDDWVDFADLLLVIAAWGPCPAPPDLCPEDLNHNGIVDFADILQIIGTHAWPLPCPTM